MRGIGRSDSARRGEASRASASTIFPVSGYKYYYNILILIIIVIMNIVVTTSFYHNHSEN